VEGTEDRLFDHRMKLTSFDSLDHLSQQEIVGIAVRPLGARVELQQRVLEVLPHVG